MTIWGACKLKLMFNFTHLFHIGQSAVGRLWQAFDWRWRSVAEAQHFGIGHYHCWRSCVDNQWTGSDFRWHRLSRCWRWLELSFRWCYTSNYSIFMKYGVLSNAVLYGVLSNAVLSCQTSISFKFVVVLVVKSITNIILRGYYFFHAPSFLKHSLRGFNFVDYAF